MEQGGTRRLLEVTLINMANHYIANKIIYFYMLTDSKYSFIKGEWA